MALRSRTIAATHRQAGYSLLELLIVLGIVAVLLGITAWSFQGAPSTRVPALAQELTSALRHARAQAIQTGTPARLVIDLKQRRYHWDEGAQTATFSANIKVDVTTALSETSADGLAAIRFFPDGSSTGGQITLSEGAVTRLIAVNWLTGRAVIEDQEPAP